MQRNPRDTPGYLISGALLFGAAYAALYFGGMPALVGLIVVGYAVYFFI